VKKENDDFLGKKKKKEYFHLYSVEENRERSTFFE
jgi:hypothetical protein